MKFGISIYPEHSEPERDMEYIETAAGYGCRRIFTCLLSARQNREDIIRNYRSRIDRAHRCGMEVILDTARRCFTLWGCHTKICRSFRNFMPTASGWMRALTP